LNFHLKGKLETRARLFSSSRNLIRERELYLVLQSSWRERFGNHFSDNFGNCSERTGKLRSLLSMVVLPAVVGDLVVVVLTSKQELFAQRTVRLG
jgi:hypothetical protein